jgi:hypothetical protein
VALRRVIAQKEVALTNGLSAVVEEETSLLPKALGVIALMVKGKTLGHETIRVDCVSSLRPKRTLLGEEVALGDKHERMDLLGEEDHLLSPTDEMLPMK